jgi:hypothetical protein
MSIRPTTSMSNLCSGVNDRSSAAKSCGKPASNTGSRCSPRTAFRRKCATISRSFTISTTIPIKMNKSGTVRLASGKRRKITHALTMMLNPIIARTI